MIFRHPTTDELLEQLTLENTELKKELEAEKEESQKWLQWADLVTRVVRNGKMSAAYRLLYISLIDTYPHLLFTGERTEVHPCEIREHAGWLSEKSAGNFLQDMTAIKAIEYESGSYNKKTKERTGYIKANVNTFPYPEDFDTKKTEARRKARDAEAKKRKEYKETLKRFLCENCSSENLTYDVTAVCQSCGYVHETVKDIPAANIQIEDEIHEEMEWQPEEFIDQPPAPRPAAVSITALHLEYSTHPPESLQRANEPCPICKRTRRECYVPVTDAPGIWTFSCM